MVFTFYNLLQNDIKQFLKVSDLKVKENDIRNKILHTFFNIFNETYDKKRSLINFTNLVIHVKKIFDSFESEFENENTTFLLNFLGI